jgi:hypothetical protein
VLLVFISGKSARILLEESTMELSPLRLPGLEDFFSCCNDEGPKEPSFFSLMRACCKFVKVQPRARALHSYHSLSEDHALWFSFPPSASTGEIVSPVPFQYRLAEQREVQATWQNA